ncbi:MAG: peroxiredoxin [Fimbriimonadaceae bacterium]|nr:peroxiredoxin [Fimbriimonadaceae bacterium]
MVTTGQRFPGFQLEDQDGKLHSAPHESGKRAIYFFYPKDDTSGCTMEACEFRDSLPRFSSLRSDIAIFGVSPDPVKSHAKFAKKYDLNYPLLADTERQLIESLGLWVEKSMYGKKYMGVERTTVLVGADGMVEMVWNKVKPEGHAAEVLAYLED